MIVEFSELQPAVSELLATQRYAVLGTQRTERAGLFLMALAVGKDLCTCILATESATSKYADLVRNPRMSLLVDNRSNQGSDTQEAVALTIDGQAEEVGEPEWVEHSTPRKLQGSGSGPKLGRSAPLLLKFAHVLTGGHQSLV